MPNEDQQRAEVEQRTREAMAVDLAALRADAERARWCEEMRATVEWRTPWDKWVVSWFQIVPPFTPRITQGDTRNSAIDLAMRGAK